MAINSLRVSVLYTGYQQQKNKWKNNEQKKSNSTFKRLKK